MSMSDPISRRLASISSKDPRKRSDADMAFLKWCTSGGNGSPPPGDPSATLVVSNVPQQQSTVPITSTAQPRAGAPKPTAKQLEDTFRIVAGKPVEQRTQQENEFLLGIQEMYKHRKNMGTRNNSNSREQQPQSQSQPQSQPQPQSKPHPQSQSQSHPQQVPLTTIFPDDPKPPAALVAMVQKKAQAKSKMAAKRARMVQLRQLQQEQQEQQQRRQQQELVTKSDEPDGSMNSTAASPSNFVPRGTPPVKPPRHAVPAKPMAVGSQSNMSLTSYKPILTPKQSNNNNNNDPTVANEKTLVLLDVTDEQREHAEKSLQSAMSRRLGNNMMSSLATKDLESRLVAGMRCGVDSELIARAKKLLVAVRKKKKSDDKTARKEVSASKYSGYHAAAVSNDIAKEWESKHGHLLKEAERQRKLLDEHHREEEQREQLETEKGQEDFFNTMQQRSPQKKNFGAARFFQNVNNNNSGSEGGGSGSIVNPAPVPALANSSYTNGSVSTSLVTDILTSVRQEYGENDDMTQEEAEEYMFGAGGVPRFTSDLRNDTNDTNDTNSTNDTNDTDETDNTDGNKSSMFDGPPSTPPAISMPSPSSRTKQKPALSTSPTTSPTSASRQYDTENWRTVPKFLNSKRDEEKLSPYRSALELATSSRYTSPKYTEKSADREAGIESTKLALRSLEDAKANAENEDEDDSDNTSRKVDTKKNASSLNDDLPAFMLLEECWNSVQLARTTMDKINGTASPEDHRKKTNLKSKKKTSPLDRYKPKKT
jgi:hypothetical protein